MVNDLNFKVFYCKEPSFRDDSMPKDMNHFEVGWVFLKDVDAENLEDLFVKMQGEVWSPKGEANDLIKGLGLHHTSMSVGDVAVDENRNIHFCAMIGWEKLGFKYKTNKELLNELNIKIGE